MVTTNDDRLADRVNMMRNHGASISEEQRLQGAAAVHSAEFNLLGFNYRMTDLQGAVGIVQLGKLDQFIEERDRWARASTNGNWPIFRGCARRWVPEGYRHGWQSYVCYVDEAHAHAPRNEPAEKLQSWASVPDLHPCGAHAEPLP
jgi:dTDP-4-amino-4,6-dideoxygalactose transaminase